MKKTSRSRTHAESAGRRKLWLSKEAIRMLRVDDLTAANGGAGCDTTSFSTEKHTDSTVPTTLCK
jgi:hypothetical protein